jgi:hypothetical protein
MELKNNQLLDEFKILLKEKDVAVSHFCSMYKLAVNRFRNILSSKTAIGAEEINAVMDWVEQNRYKPIDIENIVEYPYVKDDKFIGYSNEDGIIGSEALCINDTTESIHPKTNMTIDEILNLINFTDDTGIEFVKYIFDNQKDISTAIVQSDSDNNIWEFLDFFVQSEDIHLIGHIFIQNTIFNNRYRYLGLVSVDHKDKIMLIQMIDDFNKQYKGVEGEKK